MEVSELKGKKITVMGLGLHGGGVGMIRFLVEAGARVVATDLKTKTELQLSLDKLVDLGDSVSYVLGEHREQDFLQTEMVIKNPGVSWTNRYVQLALKNDIPVEIDSSLFFKLCKNRIIGVTGTRGKTTTATLIYEILHEAGMYPVKVGIGQVSVLDRLNDLQADSIVVFELSSWRLSALGRYGLSPEIAVLTNIYQDHLNYYADMDEYVADKSYICKYQQPNNFCIINGENEKLEQMAKMTKAQIVKFSRQELDGERKVFLKENAIWVAVKEDKKEVLRLDEIKIKGEHNISNILASVGVALVLGIEMDIVKKAIRSFRGIPHRLELVRELDGVKYYNDTAATSPDGAIFGIQSFNEEIVLICGGSDKNLDMIELAKVIQRKIKKIIFLQGAGTDKLISILQLLGWKNELVIASSMKEAVLQARKLAVDGEVILLSPGAASFGLFLNEFDRGDQFRDIVNDLKYDKLRK